MSSGGASNAEAAATAATRTLIFCGECDRRRDIAHVLYIILYMYKSTHKL